MRTAVLACVFVAGNLAAAGNSAEYLLESARDLPVACDVDVVVVGGTSGAVAAAVAAAEAGARVFLAAPKTYLGEDLCATYRLWLEADEEPKSPLAKAIFTPPSPPLTMGKGLPFTYEADRPSDAPHKDTAPPSLLANGQWGNAATHSVQYGDNVSLVLDLGKEIRLGGIHVLPYQRRKDFEMQAATIWTSLDKQAWTEASVIRNEKAGKENAEDRPLHLYTALTGPARYIKVLAAKTDAAKRILLAEIVIEAETPSPAAPEVQTESRRPPMPMQAKRALDDALIKAGVNFLYGCYPAGVLRDDAGQPAGLVIANRAGRQAVTAKVIIDATARAAVARMAGAQFEPYPAGDQRFQRVTGAAQASEAPELAVQKLPAPLQIEQAGWSDRSYCNAFEYTLTLPMKDGSYASFAEAEQRARDLTWNATQLTSSDLLFQVPPDPMHGKKRAGGPWPGAQTVDLDAMRPDGVAYVFVLGGCADVTREAAAALLRPLNLLELGARVGSAAAAEARALPAPKNPRIHNAGAPEASPGGAVREVLNGPRPTDAGLSRVHSDPQPVPVLGRYDVVVVGGGTGGAPAGIAAARQGAKTLVLEFQDGLGGVGTLGLIGSYYYGFREGFTRELDQGVAAMGEGDRAKIHTWNVEWKMEWYRRELRKAGADIWFGALGCGALVEENRVTGVVVATPDGRGVVLAKVVIDATGNADIAAAAGAQCMTTGAAHVGVQGTGMPPYKPGERYTNTDYTITDDADLIDVWRTYLAGRAKYKEAFDVSRIVDSRERRRVVGDCIISPLDIWNQRTYPDTIGLSKSNFDTHGFTVHALFALRAPDKEEVSAYTPYRALLPKGLDGLLVTGLAISAHRDAMPILRMQPDIQNQGYAAGVAAAMAVRADKGLRAIDLKALQQHLVEVGNLPESVLADHDSYPYAPEQLRAAIAALPETPDRISIVLTQPEEALPLLREAYKAAGDEAKLNYAHVLGVLGDAAGADSLVQAIAGKPWDSGWSFTGGGQYGGSLSPMDSQIIALARTHDPRALALLVEKARQLDAESAFSHHRAMAIAFETTGRPEAADCLAELLKKPGMSGFVCLDIAAVQRAAEVPDPNLDRDRSLRELLLARALYRCGDRDGLAAGILAAYERDLRGHWARHAHAILAGAAQEREPGSELDIERPPASPSGK